MSKLGVSYENIFNIYHHQILLISLKFTKSKEVSEEIVQNVLMILWKKRKLLDDEGSLEALLFKITKDLNFNFLKKALREKSSKELFRLHQTDIGDFTENSIVCDEYYQIATQAISRLPKKQRVIFKMNRFMGLSYEAIAEKLCISKNTVKVQLVRANKSLRKALAVYVGLP
ncbi:MAG: sigma-70 family RNA polymerase sigma factor [Cyclobacteriaceae bacterium]